MKRILCFIGVHQYVKKEIQTPAVWGGPIITYHACKNCGRVPNTLGYYRKNVWGKK